VAPAPARIRSSARGAGTTAPSFSSCHAIAGAPTCAHGFCSSRAHRQHPRLDPGRGAIGDRARRLPRQPTPDRLAPQRDLQPLHRRLRHSLNTSARASEPARTETIRRRLNPQPRKRCAGGYR
jgi:hypothetical protein